MTTLPGLPSRRQVRGLTLIEITAALVAILALASATVIMMAQQTQFAQQLARQNFILEEAPHINNLLTRILGRVDSYRIYPDVSTAKSEGTTLLGSGSAILLTFRNSRGQEEKVIIGAEPDGASNVRVGVYAKSGTWPGSPSWVLTRFPASMTFSLNQGVLQVTLTGPNLEEITFSGHTQS